MSRDISACFSSNSDEWETPKNLFDTLDQEFKFDIDLCSNDSNCLCKWHYTKETFNVFEIMSIKDKSIYCNPPYSNVGYFVQLCSVLGLVNDVCMLIPSRTDTKWFHEYIYNNPLVHLMFIKGRLRFCKSGVPQKSAPFPSMVVKWYGKSRNSKKTSPNSY